MSKKAYIGVNGIARNVSNIYVGVNGVARKVVKGYVGVNGVAQQFWGASAPSFPESWDFWSTLQEQLFVLGNYTVRKTEKLITYYAVVQDSIYDYVVLISPFSNGVSFSFTFNGQTFYRTSPLGSFTDVNNITWYFNYQSLDIKQSTISKDCRLNNNVYYMGYNPDYTYNDQAPRDLLAKVYAVPFNITYPLAVATDIRKTLRKVYGLALVFGNSYSSQTKYQTLSDNADTLINDIVTAHGSGDKVFSAEVYTYWANTSDDVRVLTSSCSISDGNLSQYPGGRSVQNGFTYYVLGQPCIPSSAPSLNSVNYLVGSSITPTSESASPSAIGVVFYNGGSFKNVYSGNWGIVL